MNPTCPLTESERDLMRDIGKELLTAEIDAQRLAIEAHQITKLAKAKAQQANVLRAQWLDLARRKHAE